MRRRGPVAPKGGPASTLVVRACMSRGNPSHNGGHQGPWRGLGAVRICALCGVLLNEGGLSQQTPISIIIYSLQCRFLVGFLCSGCSPWLPAPLRQVRCRDHSTGRSGHRCCSREAEHIATITNDRRSMKGVLQRDVFDAGNSCKNGRPSSLTGRGPRISIIQRSVIGPELNVVPGIEGNYPRPTAKTPMFGRGRNRTTFGPAAASLEGVRGDYRERLMGPRGSRDDFQSPTSGGRCSASSSAIMVARVLPESYASRNPPWPPPASFNPLRTNGRLAIRKRRVNRVTRRSRRPGGVASLESFRPSLRCPQRVSGLTVRCRPEQLSNSISFFTGVGPRALAHGVRRWGARISDLISEDGLGG